MKSTMCNAWIESIPIPIPTPIDVTNQNQDLTWQGGAAALPTFPFLKPPGEILALAGCVQVTISLGLFVG